MQQVPLIQIVNHISRLCHYELIKSGAHIMYKGVCVCVGVFVCLCDCNRGETMKDVCVCEPHSCYQVLALMRFHPSKTLCDYSYHQE